MATSSKAQATERAADRAEAGLAAAVKQAKQAVAEAEKAIGKSEAELAKSEVGKDADKGAILAAAIALERADAYGDLANRQMDAAQRVLGIVSEVMDE